MERDSWVSNDTISGAGAKALEALDKQPTSSVKIENPTMLKLNESWVVLKAAKANVHRLVDRAKDLAVAVSSVEGASGQCELLEQATRNLEAFSNELRVAVRSGIA